MFWKISTNLIDIYLDWLRKKEDKMYQYHMHEKDSQVFFSKGIIMKNLMPMKCSNSDEMTNPLKDIDYQITQE